ncbi:MAG: 30S ribosomal protein S17 [Candidatus Neomarinimicrobiota bacterium]
MVEFQYRQALIGEVVSCKMEKTVVVKVTRRVLHPVYKKYVNRYKKFLAHAESVVPKEGDIVKILSSRPISKNKCWRVSEIVRESLKLETPS